MYTAFLAQTLHISLLLPYALSHYISSLLTSTLSPQTNSHTISHHKLQIYLTHPKSFSFLSPYHTSNHTSQIAFILSLSILSISLTQTTSHSRCVHSLSRPPPLPFLYSSRRIYSFPRCSLAPTSNSSIPQTTVRIAYILSLSFLFIYVACTTHSFPLFCSYTFHIAFILEVHSLPPSMHSPLITLPS